ncbi:MAG: hypothetical protein H8E32_05375 [Nitrospinae bacterium]|nr:hypothetical protein [Nitrospinota bacterium]
MSVYLFEGLQGSGKSFHIVKEIIVPALHKNRPVFHNLPLHPEIIEMNEDLVCQTAPLLTEIDGEFIRNLPFENTEEKGFPLNGAVIVIDEIQDHFVSTEAMWSKEMLKFFAMHRHFHLDIVIGTQDKGNINRVIRNFVKYHWHFDKLDRFGHKNSYRIDYFQKNDEEPYRSTFEKFNKKYFEYYDSYDPKSAKKGNIEEPIGRKDNSLHFTIAAMVGSLLICIYVLSRVIDRDANAEEFVDIDQAGQVEKPGLKKKVDSDMNPEKITAEKVVVYNLKGDRVEVAANAKRTGFIKIGNTYRTIIDDGGKSVIAKSYKPLGFEKKQYRPKASDFKKVSPSVPSHPQRGREGRILNHASPDLVSRVVNRSGFNRGASLEGGK